MNIYKPYKPLLVILAVFVCNACAPEEGITPDNIPLVAPEIPPAEMYTMPIESFTETDVDTSGRTNRLNYRPTYRNWVHSVVSLVAWNTGVALNVAVPLTAFGLAVNEEPVYLGDDTFEWSYQYEAPDILGGKTYNIVLTGTYLSLEEVEWRMLLSEEGGFQDFEWYTGLVATDFSSARFVVYHQPLDPQPLFNINFDKDLTFSDPDDFDLKLRYTTIDPNSEGIGGYVEFRTQPEDDLNRVFEVKGGPGRPEISTEIEWSIPSGEGRVRDNKRFGDNEWRCWNEILQDVDC